MPPVSRWGNFTLQPFTVLLFCLTLFQGVDESANASSPQNTDSNTSAPYHESVKSGLGPAPTAQTNSTSVENLAANLNVSSQQSLIKQPADPHASKPLSETNTTAVALSEVLTQQDSCPADANAATAPHITGQHLLGAPLPVLYS